MIMFFALAYLFMQYPAIQDPPDKNTWKNPKDDMEFVWIPSGTLKLKEEGKLLRRNISGFYMGIYEVTVSQFSKFVDDTGYITRAEQADSLHTWKNPGIQQAPDHPVVYISFEDAQAYTKWAGVELPSESQWLFAARDEDLNCFRPGSELDDHLIWHRQNSQGHTHPVDSKSANRRGLYHMVGHVYEWCKFEAKDSVCQLKGIPRGGSWTRCPQQIYYDIPNPPTDCIPWKYVLSWDDDRGFRCIYSGSKD
ncbi:MAG: formylglycine-generating enzyme family protein [Candidatus Cyclobacteriaceae bacterium M3_2C_046]